MAFSSRFGRSSAAREAAEVVEQPTGEEIVIDAEATEVSEAPGNTPIRRATAVRPCRRCGRPAPGTWYLALPVWPTSRKFAGDLGHWAGPAAGRPALFWRSDKRQPAHLVAGWLGNSAWPDFSLQSALYHCPITRVSGGDILALIPLRDRPQAPGRDAES